MKTVIKKIIVVILCVIMSTTISHGYDILHYPPLVTKEQAVAFLKDRNATDKYMSCVNYIYSYSEKIGVDPSLIIAMSCLETGYGKSNLFRNYNNPGGIKSKHGWAKFDTPKKGFKYMIELLATYAGVMHEDSWLYNYSKTTEGLAGMYWTNQGTDRGYHQQIVIVINTMSKYPKAKKKSEVNVEKKVKENDVQKNTLSINKEKDTRPIDIIYNILHKKDKSKAYLKILEYINKEGD